MIEWTHALIAGFIFSDDLILRSGLIKAIDFISRGRGGLICRERHSWISPSLNVLL